MHTQCRTRLGYMAGMHPCMPAQYIPSQRPGAFEVCAVCDQNPIGGLLFHRAHNSLAQRRWFGADSGGEAGQLKAAISGRQQGTDVQEIGEFFLTQAGRRPPRTT